MLEMYTKPENLEQMLENRAIERIGNMAVVVKELFLETDILWTKLQMEETSSKTRMLQAKLDTKQLKYVDERGRLIGYVKACIDFFDWDRCEVKEFLYSQGLTAGDIKELSYPEVTYDR